MSKRFLSGINVTGTATLNTVADAGSNTDKFLVLDASNNVSYRTAAELYADLGIGALPSAYTSTLKHEVKASQTISKGQAVYVSSADGTNMIVSKASNVSEQYSSKTMGLLETSLVTNGKGNVITEGLLSGLNTNGAAAGDPVWLGVDGALIFGLVNKPVAPAHLVFIGIVTRANANNGEIFVKVQNGFEMKELHNYAEGSVQNNEVIVYESATSLYKPKSIPTILGYTPVPDSRTITINGTTYDLSANRSWTVSANQNARTEYEFTTNGSTATYSAVYSVGQVDVFYNGSKLSSTEFTASNGTSVTLGFTPPSGQLVELVAWDTGGGVTNGRTLTINGVAFDLSANRSWTIDNASLGAQAQLNGTGLVRMNGTTVTYDNATYATQSYVTTAISNLINAAPATLDTLNELAAALGNDANFATTVTNSIATKQAQLNGTGFVKISGTTISYDNSTYLTTASAASIYLTTASAASTYLTISTAASTYLTSSSAASTYLAKSGGTLTGALSGTSATFSSTVTSNRFYGTYSSILNTYTTVNPSSNVLLISSPNDRDAWIYLDQADTGTNWGIYHRQIDSAVGILPANSIGFVGGGSSTLQAYISLANGNAYFSGSTLIGTTTTPSSDYKFAVRQGLNRNLAIATQGSELSIEAYNDTFTSSVPLRFYSSNFSFLNGAVGIGTSTTGAYILAVDYNASAAAVMSIKNYSASGYSGAHILNNLGQVMGHWGYANGSTGAPLTDTVYFGSTAAKSVVFTTSDTIRMSINPSGYVTRPFQPAFMAYSSGVTVNAGYWQIISNSITTEAYDIGSNYSGGRFTAPVAGRYYFFFGGWSNINSNGERYGISFVVNSGSTYYIAGGNYCIVDSPLAGASIVHNLAAGDYVELHIFTSVGGTWGGGHGVWWGGYLL